MKSILVLTGKEFKGYFKTPIAYIYLFVFLLVNSWLFFQGLFLDNHAEMRSFFALIPWLFLFLIPSITMRLWSEEKRLSTFEMLLTLPVSESELILGKFLSACLFLALSLALTFNIPLTLSYLGKPDMGPIVGGYIGALLMGGAFISIGLFASAITSNQIIAFILGIAISFFFLVIGQNTFLYNLTAPFAYFFQKLSISAHFKSISRGIIDPGDIIYYFSIILFFLYLNKAVLELRYTQRKIWGELKKSARTSSKAFVLLACILSINFLLTKFNLRMDITKNHKYTLSESSKNVVGNLEKPLYIRMYFSQDLPSYMVVLNRDVRDIISDYSSYSHGKIIIESKNPLQDKKTEKRVIKMGIPKVQLNVFEGEEASIRTAFLGIEIEYNGKNEILPVVQSTYSLEYDLTSKIKKLTRDNNITIAFLSGHGEKNMYKKYSRLREELEKVYSVKEVNFKTGRTLEGVNTLIVPGPVDDLPTEEAFLIDQFIMNGGKIIFLIDQYRINWGNMKAIPLDLGNWVGFLKNYGIELDGGVISDPMCARASFQQGSNEFSSTYPFWPKITPPGMNDNSKVVSLLPSFVLPWSSPLTFKESGNSFSFLAKTSPFSSLKKGNIVSLTPLKRYNPHGRKKFTQKKQRFLLAGILKGRFNGYFRGKDTKTLNQIMEETDTTGQYISKSVSTEVAAIGTSHFAENDTLATFPNNKRFILNLVDWMSMGSDLISIRLRNVENNELKKLSANQKFWIRHVNVFGWSVLSMLILAGFVRMLGYVQRKS